MPLYFQHRIYRHDLKANPNARFVFGDNAHRIGMGGQAAEMRGEPNAIGVATKFYPTNDDWAFFSDDKFEEQKEIIHQDLQQVRLALSQKRVVVWPLDGIGTGLSDLPNKSPKTHAYLQGRLLELAGL